MQPPPESRRKLDPAHVHATRSTRVTETQSNIAPSIAHKMTASQQQLLLDLESESEDDESEIPDSVFKESFRLNRKQFSEVHELIKMDITGHECNAQKLIGSEEKLAICLR
ncbi:hypothetical protein QTP88_001840 [Uroleucon formosanum]